MASPAERTPSALRAAWEAGYAACDQAWRAHVARGLAENPQETTQQMLQRWNTEACMATPAAPEPPVGDAWGWLSLASVSPLMGAGVLLYLRPCAGVAGHDCYRAGVYMGPNEWRCATTWEAPASVFRDADISHWQYLPEPPPKAAAAPAA
jgi:hypothetical protein